jgi:hypothetical protein
MTFSIFTHLVAFMLGGTLGFLIASTLMHIWSAPLTVDRLQLGN